MILKKELYLFGMLLFGAAYAACCISSSKYKFILSHDHCSSFPSIDVISHDKAIEELRKIVDSSKDSIRVVIRSNLIDDVYNILLKKNKTVTIIYNDLKDSFLNKLKADFPNTYSLKKKIDFNVVIADKTVFIAPFLFNNTEKRNVVRIMSSDCDAFYNDINGYLNFVKLSTKSPVYSQTMIGHSTAVRPTIVGNTSFFFAQQPKSFDMPLRTSANKVIAASASRFPTDVYIYGNGFPNTATPKKADGGAPLVFITMRLLQMSNTNFHVLVDSSSISAYNLALSCHNNTTVRILKEEDQGLSFMIIDNELFLFSTNFDKLDSNDLYSLHMEVMNEDVRSKFLKYYTDAEQRSLNTTIECNFTV